MDILSLANQTPSTSYNLTANVQKQVQAQAQKQVQQVADSFSPQVGNLKQQSTALDTADTSITTAINAITSSINDIDTMNASLLNMSGAVFNAADNPDYAATSFDAYRQTINSLANDPSATNLLGSQQVGGAYLPNQVTYTTDANGTQVTVQGTYSGAEYQISQPDGSFFMSNGVQTVQRYDAYPLGAVGYGISTSSQNVKLDSFSADGTISFTTGQSLAPSAQQTFTGTVSNAGLPVYSAWMYNNFATPADQQKAQADITQAQSQLAVTRANLETELTAAQNAQTNEQTAQQNVTAQITDLQNQAQLQEQAVQAKSQQQFNVIIQNLAQAGVNTSAAGNPFSDSSGLFTALASQPAPGAQVTQAQAQAQAKAVNPDVGVTGILSGAVNSSASGSLFDLLA